MKACAATKSKKNKISPFARNVFFSCIVLLFSICCYAISSLFFADDSAHTHFNLGLESICELSTLECRYHNVAIQKEEGGFLGIGYEEIWLEYDGLITVGIDLNKAYFAEQPSKDGIIEIYLPPAEILSGTVDKKSIKVIVCDSDIFTSITASDQLEIISKTEKAMEQDAQVNNSILKDAHENAKRILDAHVKNLSNTLGTTYIIHWLDAHPNGVSNTNSTANGITD